MPSQSRLDSGPDIRLTNTDSLLALDDRFIKKSRKQDAHSASGRPFCFPNGEVFRPRNGPTKRNKPAKSPKLDIPRTGSMVLISSAASGQSTVASISSPSYLTSSASFSNLKLKLKSDLVLLIRNNKMDTPTNINITYLAQAGTAAPQQQQQNQQQQQQHQQPPFHPRLFLLTNNRYTQNSTNIVRLELLLHSLSETFGNGKSCGSDLNPSSLSNYNLNRSNSNTPQTSVSTTENINDALPSEESEAPPAMQRTSSLELIQESGSSDTTAKISPNTHNNDSKVSSTEANDANHEGETLLNAPNLTSDDTRDTQANAQESTGTAPNEESKQPEQHASSQGGDESSSENNLDCVSMSSKSDGSSSDAVEANDDSTVQQSPDIETHCMAESSRISDQVPQSGEVAGFNVPPNDTPQNGGETEHSDLANLAMIGTSNSMSVENPGALSPEDSNVKQLSTNEHSGESAYSTPLSEPADHFAMPGSSHISQVSSLTETASTELPEPTIKLESSNRSRSQAEVVVNGRSPVSNTDSREVEDSPDSVPIFSDIQIVEKPSLLPIHSPEAIDNGRPLEIETPKHNQSFIQRAASLIRRSESRSADLTPTGLAEVRSSTPVKLLKTSGQSLPATPQALARTPVKASNLSHRQDNSGLKNAVQTKHVQARPVRSLLEPLESDRQLKQVNHAFSSRKNVDLQLKIEPQVNADVSEILPDAPTPISKDSYRLAALPNKPKELTGKLPQNPTISTTNGSSTEKKKSELLAALASDSHSKKQPPLPSDLASVVSVSALYSQGQIEKFLADDQPEVPPRGDLDVSGKRIKVHKRNTSSITSMNSLGTPKSPLLDSSPSKLKTISKISEDVGSSKGGLSKTLETSQLDNRLSMLNVVDVDFDKSLPPTPERKNKYTGRFSLLGDPLASPSNNNSSPKSKARKDFDLQKMPVVEETASLKLLNSISNIRKVFRMFGSDSKSKSNKEPFKELKKRSSSRDIRSGSRASTDGSKPSTKATLKRSVLEPTKLNSSDQDTNALPKSSSRRKKFVLNLKMASMTRLDEVPSPVYSVRERPTSPDVPPLTTLALPKFDLPQYEVENDMFDDILLKFDEVEKEAEKEVEQHLITPKSLNLFLKDDELTKAQIADQQKNDNQLSDESLPRKFSNNSDGWNGAADEVPLTGDSNESPTQVWYEDEDVLTLNFADFLTEVTAENGESHVVIKKEGLVSLNSDKINHNLMSYLKHVKQFQDYEEVEIRMKEFHPGFAEERTISGGPASSLLKSGHQDLTSSKSVKFSNTVYITETFPSYMYKRYNKSVTQYYLTEFAQVNRIKNELNAYKCHEMLVHEKSQMNTHFFY